MYKKRNVAYVKPNEPSFLTKLKKEAGYVPGPDINTKKNRVPIDSDSDSDPEKPDENPVVVVLKPGDLTAEEAAKITADKELRNSEEANAPADLSKKIIFQKPVKGKRNNKSFESEIPLKKKQREIPKKTLLSFDNCEEDEF